MNQARSAAEFCVVFDIDDTLYLERDYVRSGFHAVGQWLETERGVSGFGEAAWDAFVRGVRGNTFNLCLEGLGVEPAPVLVKKLVGVYREHRPRIELLPDARAALDAVTDAGWAVAALTDGPLASQMAKAAALGVAGWADPVVFTAELGPGRGKPHPAGFQLIERQTGASGASCVYIADNPHKDFVAPRKLGWRTVRVRRAGGLHADTPSQRDVDVEVSNLESLPQLLFPEHS